MIVSDGIGAGSRKPQPTPSLRLALVKPGCWLRRTWSCRRSLDQLRRANSSRPQAGDIGPGTDANGFLGEIRAAGMSRTTFTGDTRQCMSMLKPKLPDDPHDIIVVAPDAVRVAPADERLADPIRDLIPGASLEPQIHAGSDFSAGRPCRRSTRRFARPPSTTSAICAAGRSAGGRCAPVTALLLTACIGGAAVAWQFHGDTVQRLIAEWAPLFAQVVNAAPEKAPPVQPVLAAAQVDATMLPAPQPAPAGPDRSRSRRQRLLPPPPSPARHRSRRWRAISPMPDRRSKRSRPASSN